MSMIRALWASVRGNAHSLSRTLIKLEPHRLVSITVPRTIKVKGITLPLPDRLVYLQCECGKEFHHDVRNGGDADDVLLARLFRGEPDKSKNS
jgi:hypothetical protein